MDDTDFAIEAPSEKHEFELVPSGLHVAVLADVMDLGQEENRYKPGKFQHKVRFIFQICGDVRQKNGSRFLLMRKYTASLDDRADLKKDLSSWLENKLYTRRNKQGEQKLHPKDLIGRAANVQVIHVEKDNKTYANLAMVAPYTGDEEPEIENYTRPAFKSKDVEPEPAPEASASGGDHSLTDDDIPF
jgi:hypothetical protein